MCEALLTFFLIVTLTYELHLRCHRKRKHSYYYRKSKANIHIKIHVNYQGTYFKTLLYEYPSRERGRRRKNTWRGRERESWIKKKKRYVLYEFRKEMSFFEAWTLRRKYNWFWVGHSEKEEDFLSEGETFLARSREGGKGGLQARSLIGCRGGDVDQSAASFLSHLKKWEWDGISFDIKSRRILRVVDAYNNKMIAGKIRKLNY